MANDDYIAQLKKGAPAWNAWLAENLNLHLDLSGADLSGANLRGANLRQANLRKADLREADLREADLRKADLRKADLNQADLIGADLREAELYEADLGATDLRAADLHAAILVGADLYRADLFRADLSGAKLVGARLMRAKLGNATLSGANLNGADLTEADLSHADLSEAHLSEARLFKADLREAKLIRAYLSSTQFVLADLRAADLRDSYLSRANFTEANLGGANLSEAELEAATLVETDLTGADLTACRVYGVSAWGLKLGGSKQQNLIITPAGAPEITVDNVEVAQFIYLMLHNQKIRDVIDTITSKAVLILGRFTDERKAVLDALREELRKHDYLPILFDFAVPATRDITETISLLARMARFIIADLTDPSSIPKELEAIVPGLAVPVQPLLEGSTRPYAMFKDYWKYEWVLPVYRYEGLDPLLAALAQKVIAPAEAKVEALAERRRMIEAELTKPR